MRACYLIPLVLELFSNTSAFANNSATMTITMEVLSPLRRSTMSVIQASFACAKACDDGNSSSLVCKDDQQCDCSCNRQPICECH